MLCFKIKVNQFILKYESYIEGHYNKAETLRSNKCWRFSIQGRRRTPVPSQEALCIPGPSKYGHQETRYRLEQLRNR